MADIGDVYNTKVLELAANMPCAGRLAHPHATSSAQSKLCGSRITIDLAMHGDVVSAYAQDVKACLLGQASAAIVGARIIGATAAEMRQVGAQMRAMLKENAPPPEGRWADLSILESVRAYKARHASTLLVFDAVEAALDQICAFAPPACAQPSAENPTDHASR